MSVKPTCRGLAALCLQHLKVAPLTTRDEVRCWLKIMLFHSPAAFNAPVRGSHQNTAIRLGLEKREWCGYRTVKNSEDMFTRFDRIHKCDRQTD